MRTSLLMGVTLCLVGGTYACGDSGGGTGGAGGQGGMTGTTTGVDTGTGTGTGPDTGTGTGSGTDTGTGTGMKDLSCLADMGECVPGTGDCDAITGAGSACDFDGKAYTCYMAPNDVELGGLCNGQDGPFCLDGLTCLDGACIEYCCADTDCTVDGPCDMELNICNGGG